MPEPGELAGVRLELALVDTMACAACAPESVRGAFTPFDPDAAELP
jgi:hypothetical protein